MGAADVFYDVFALVLFFSALWIVGKLSTRLGLPSVVGEIVTGIILGPYFLDFVPYPSALKIFGDIGLLLLVVEAGIDVQMGLLKVVGTRGLMIAIFGSIFPAAIATGAAYILSPNISSSQAIAIGSCFAPTSLGIALNVLRDGNVLNTPIGQLIVGAAILDDVIALMLLSVLYELSNPDATTFDILLPILTSPILILIFGFIAMKISPSVIKSIMNKIDIKYHEYAILFLLFTSMLVLVPCCFYAKSSYLLGGFLSGLLFCTDHTIHHVWEKQMQKIMHWLLRIFFACTIAFEVPIKDFIDPDIVIASLVYFTAIIGKWATGIFAPGKPLNMVQFFTVGFSMSAWGEFAFILATMAYNDGIFSKETLTEILLAVLLSVIFSPLFLRITIVAGQKQKSTVLKLTRKHVVNTLRVTGDEYDADSLDEATLRSSIITAESYITPQHLHYVYYYIHTKTFGKWGHQDRLLRCLYSLDLEIIDFREFNEAQDNYSHDTPFVEDVFYVKDTQLKLLPTKQLSLSSQRKLQKRVHVIKFSLKDALQDKGAKIAIMRWLPGIKKDFDEPSVPKLLKKISVSYVRDEAYREARVALSRTQFTGWRRTLSVNYDDAAIRSPSAPQTQQMLPKLTRTTSAAQQILHSPVKYLSRIRSNDDLFGRRTKKVNHRTLDVHDEKHDDLVELNLADSVFLLRYKYRGNDGDCVDDDDDNDLSADSTSINLNIIKVDQHSKEANNLLNPLGIALVKSADHKTPLLKKKKRFPTTPP